MSSVSELWKKFDENSEEIEVKYDFQLRKYLENLSKCIIVAIKILIKYWEIVIKNFLITIAVKLFDKIFHNCNCSKNFNKLKRKLESYKVKSGHQFIFTFNMATIIYTQSSHIYCQWYCVMRNFVLWQGQRCKKQSYHSLHTIQCLLVVDSTSNDTSEGVKHRVVTSTKA